MSRFVLLAAGIVCLAGLSAPAAPGLKEKEDKSDLKKLEGDWKIESWVQLGTNVPMDATWSFKGDKYTLTMPSNTEEGSIKIDQDKKPAVMDLVITGGNCSGKEQPGIYKFDGETLICCFAWPGTTDRPTDFTSTADNRFILITLKRAK
jgi:uncharacterized protein (TIGR03067 family)